VVIFSKWPAGHGKERRGPCVEDPWSIGSASRLPLVGERQLYYCTEKKKIKHFEQRVAGKFVVRMLSEWVAAV